MTINLTSLKSTTFQGHEVFVRVPMAAAYYKPVHVLLGRVLHHRLRANGAGKHVRHLVLVAGQVLVHHVQGDQGHDRLSSWLGGVWITAHRHRQAHSLPDKSRGKEAEEGGWRQSGESSDHNVCRLLLQVLFLVPGEVLELHKQKRLYYGCYLRQKLLR